jgi:ferrochelatase
MIRAATVGTHPAFIGMIRELILERVNGDTTPRALGMFTPAYEYCAADCCLPGSTRPTARPAAD